MRHMNTTFLVVGDERVRTIDLSGEYERQDVAVTIDRLSLHGSVADIRQLMLKVIASLNNTEQVMYTEEVTS